MELTEEKKNLNFVLWTDKLKDYGCYSESLINAIGEKVKNASFNCYELNGGCYEGSLIDVILNNLCTIAVHINEKGLGINEKGKIRHPFLCVNTEMLIRILLLQHISKAEMFIANGEKWKRDKGYKYDFSGDLETQLKVGERSAYLCMKHGIDLSEIEFEAMTIIDKKEECFNSHITPLALLVKIVNQLVSVELQKKIDYYNTVKNR